MPRFSSLAGALTLGNAALDAMALKYFLKFLTIIVALTIVAAVMVSALLLAGCYGVMQLLIGHGMSPDDALLVVCGIVAFIGILCAVTAALYLRKLRTALQPLAPISSYIGDVAQSFIKGFLASRQGKEGNI